MDQLSIMQTTYPLDGQEPSSEQLSSDDTSSTEETTLDFIDASEFSKAVEYHVQQFKTTYLEAIINVATQIGMEPEFDSEQIHNLVDRTLKEKLYAECVQLNLVRGEIATQIDA